MTALAADPAFDAGSVAVTDWPLCQVRLQDDARFPWLILIPRLSGMVEIEDLSPDDRTRFLDEGLRAGALIRQMGAALERPVHKLNLAALGNVTAQLHLHVIGRRRDDPLWPDPVWGRGTARPWSVAERETLMAIIRAD
jgi:diadenosine tetraphosphate (Ap4A) HIT family hydrolase